MNDVEQKIIRVLVVEDSRVVAEFLSSLLSSDPRIKVVGVAFDGEQALAAAQQEKPDVITMDIHMPRLNGFEATRRIMETCPAPIVIVSGSASTDAIATNFRAIEAGALAVIARPGAPGDPQHESQAKELLTIVKLMSEVRVVRRWARSRQAPQSSVAPSEIRRPSGGIRAVAIGASTGGPLALQTVLAGLPKSFPVPVLIVQHIAPGFAEGFVEWLSQSSGFPVRVAAADEYLLPGHAYVAPDDFHMGVSPKLHVVLSKDNKENGMRPSVSFLFRSLESVFGRNLAAVLLTGMGSDGAEQLKRLRDIGAVTIAQDEQSSVVHGMPGQAIQIGAAMHVLAPESIARALATVVSTP